LNCYPGKYEEEYKLEDSSKKQWVLKKYQVVYGSTDTFEKLKIRKRKMFFNILLIQLIMKKNFNRHEAYDL
jgi:hypothetical protein